MKAEERCIVQDESKVVQDMTLICDTPTLLQTNVQAQPMTEQKVSLPDRAIVGKLTPITHASQRESLTSESVRKEVATYIDSVCRLPSKPLDN